jgi:hypothetical protein
MRRQTLALAVPIALAAFAGCGSGTALLSSATAVHSNVAATQARTPRPSISVAKGTLSTRRLESAGGPVVVGATVTLRALQPEAVTLVAQAKDSRKNVIATRAMVLGEGNLWRTTEPGLTLPQNLSAKTASFTIVVVAKTAGPPAITRSLKVGTVTVAKTVLDSNQPPPPPTF